MSLMVDSELSDDENMLIVYDVVTKFDERIKKRQGLM